MGIACCLGQLPYAISDVSSDMQPTGRLFAALQEWDVIKRFPEVPKKGVLSLRFAPDAKSLLVGGGDHNLRVFGTPQ